MKVVLLPKGFDVANVHRLADIPSNGGKIANAEVAVGIVKQIISK